MLHWRHIKGFNGDPTSSNTYARNLFTYLEYQKGPTANISGTVLKDEKYLPKIILSGSNEQDTPTTSPSGPIIDCGHIITSNIKNTFTEVTRFNEATRFRNPLYLEYGTPIYYGQQDEQNSITGGILANGNITIHSNYGVNIYGNESLTGGIHITSNGFIVGESYNTITSYFYNNVEAQGYVQASYFNATSDIRAKENFKMLPHNMLDIVKHMQAYTFNYKNQTERTIGLIAQDLQNLDIDGFKLVTNQNATGKDNDFMAIHETKLVYILLEAVKELAAEVENLKERLGD